MWPPGQPRMLVIGAIVCLLVLADSATVKRDAYNRRFPATAVLVGEEAERFQRLEPSSFLDLGLDDDLMKAVADKTSKPRVATPAIYKHGKGQRKHMVVSLTDSGDAIDISSVHRECPPRVCGANATCPLQGGVCCKGGDTCCPRGAVCLTTTPPTCVTESAQDEFRCAEEECKAGFACPHRGVEDCCLGGQSCCPLGFKCKNTFPPTCVKLLTKAEAAKQNRHEEKLFKRKKREKDAKRTRRHKESQKRLAKADSDFKREMDKRNTAFDSNTAKKQVLEQQRQRLKREKRKAERLTKQVKKEKLLKKARLKRKELQAFKGLCTFFKHCPAGWDNKGLVGIILPQTGYSKAFLAGGPYNRDWRWTHPNLCCQTGAMKDSDPVYFVARKCPAEAKDISEFGAILLNGHSGLTQMRIGGRFNSGWKWQHGRLCKAPTYKQAQKGACMWGRHCPRGWKNNGLSGIIMVNSAYKSNPFSAGGAFNSGWKWTHPHLCCK